MELRARRRLLVRRLLVASASLLTLYAALIVFAAYSFLHPFRFPVDNTPRKLDLRFEDVHFYSEGDHLRLSG